MLLKGFKLFIHGENLVGKKMRSLRKANIEHEIISHKLNGELKVVFQHPVFLLEIPPRIRAIEGIEFLEITN